MDRLLDRFYRDDSAPPEGVRCWPAVSAMFAFNGALFGIWASRIPAVAERHDLGPGALGALLLMLALGAIVSFPLAGRAADRFGAYRVTLGIALVYVLALIACGIAPGVGALAVALAAFGATHGAMDVAMNAWASEVERKMGRPVMSSFHAMFSLGAGVGAGTGYVAVRWGLGLDLHFLLAGVALAVPAFALARIGWVSERQQTRSGSVFALPRGALALVGVVAFCTSLGEGAMADWSAIYLVLTTGASEASAALGYTVFSVAMVITRLAGDKVILWLGPVGAARAAGATAALGVVVLMGPGGLEVVLAGYALLGVGYAVVMPLAFSRAANDPVLSPGAAIARVSTLGYGGLLLGPPVIGFIAEMTSLRMAFGLLLALAVLIVVLARSLTPSPRG